MIIALIVYFRLLFSVGLKALSKSVEKQQATQSKNTFVGTVHIKIPHHNYSFDLKVRKGENIMSCVKYGSGRELLGEYLEFACGGEYKKTRFLVVLC